MNKAEQLAYLGKKIWGGEHFGKNGAVGISLQSFALARSTRNTNPKAYVEALPTAMCAVYSAINARYALLCWVNLLFLYKTLSKLCTEFEGLRNETQTRVSSTPALYECYAAYLLRAAVYVSLFHGSKYGNAMKKVAREILPDLTSAGSKVPPPTEVLALARAASSSLFSKSEILTLKARLYVYLDRAVDSDQALEMIGGWQVVVRAARHMKWWYFADVGLEYSSSKDLILKTWMLPGFILYKIGRFFGFSIPIAL